MSGPTSKGPIEYDLSADDLTAYAFSHQWLSPTIARYRRFVFFLSFFALAALPVVLALAADKPFAEALINVWPFVLAPFVYVAIGPWLTKRRTAKLVHQMMQEGESKGAYGPHKLSWDSIGLREESGRGETMRIWRFVERIVQTKSHIFIYTSGVEAFVTPLRAFGSQAEAEAFLREVAEYASVEPVKINY